MVGATGVLRPAVMACLARGWTVTAVARSAEHLALLVDEAGPSVAAVPVDVYDEQSVVSAFSATFDEALLYLAADDDDAENQAADRLQALVIGTTVRILTSRWTPAGALADGRWPRTERRLHLLLGEHRDPTTGEVRWHSPQEISAAALSVLDTGSDGVLGSPVGQVHGSQAESDPAIGALHHLELWVPDLVRAQQEWGWLLGQLGYRQFQDWPDGRSWKLGPTYLVVEQSPAMSAPTHDRLRPGFNHVAFHVGDRLDTIVEAAAVHGWTLMFADRHPYAGGSEHRAAYLHNSDGFEVELVAVRPAIAFS